MEQALKKSLKGGGLDSDNCRVDGQLEIVGIRQTYVGHPYSGNVQPDSHKINHGFSDDDDLECYWGENGGIYKEISRSQRRYVKVARCTSINTCTERLESRHRYTPRCSASDTANLLSTAASSASSNQYNTAF